MKVRHFNFAALSTLALIAIYFSIVSLVSGFGFAVDQFYSYWYFLISLAVGFGIQVGLYSYLRQIVKDGSVKMGGAVAATGTTSTISMISCCAHYLVNVLPVLGASGLIAIISQYQKEIFWFGLIFNVLGIIFIAKKIINFKKHHA